MSGGAHLPVYVCVSARERDREKDQHPADKNNDVRPRNAHRIISVIYCAPCRDGGGDGGGCCADKNAETFWRARVRVRPRWWWIVRGALSKMSRILIGIGTRMRHFCTRAIKCVRACVSLLRACAISAHVLNHFDHAREACDTSR